jgi:hypothetical protein
MSDLHAIRHHSVKQENPFNPHKNPLQGFIIRGKNIAFEHSHEEQIAQFRSLCVGANDPVGGDGRPR